MSIFSCQGTLVPAGEDIESFSVDNDVAWVLIVEKEVRLPSLNHDGLKSLLSKFRQFFRPFAVCDLQNMS